MRFYCVVCSFSSKSGPCFVTDDEVYLVSISQDLRANYFGRDAATQIEESHILDLKRTEQKVTVMATDIVIWKRDLMLATVCHAMCFLNEMVANESFSSCCDEIVCWSADFIKSAMRKVNLWKLSS